MDPMYGGGGLTPEQLQAFMEYSANQGAFTEQDRAIQQQIAQAAALRNRPQSQHTTGAGAMYGGMGDVLNQITGMRQEQTQRAKDAALQQERIKALRDLAARFGPQQQQQGLVPISPGDPGI